jgi:hypothetical protein
VSAALDHNGRISVVKGTCVSNACEPWSGRDLGCAWDNDVNVPTVLEFDGTEWVGVPAFRERFARHATACYEVSVATTEVITFDGTEWSVPDVANDVVSGDGGAIVSTAYEGKTNGAFDTSVRKLATINQVGCTCGLAYQSSSDTLFAAQFLRSYMNLYGINNVVQDAASPVFGIKNALLGTPSVFIVTSNAETGDVQPVPKFLNTTTLRAGGTPTANPAGINPFREHDVRGIQLVTKAGWGDIELGTTRATGDQPLYMVNLHLRELFIKPVSQTGEPLPGGDTMDLLDPDIKAVLFSGVQGTDYPNDIDDEESTELNIRPFALKVHKGYLYVGYVYTSQFTAGPTEHVPDPDPTVEDDNGNMYAFVVAFPEDDLVPANATRVLTMKLDYARGLINVDQPNLAATWRPWVDQVSNMPFDPSIPGDFRFVGYAQPILSDIEFDDAGNMILGFRDRGGDMVFGYSEDTADPNIYFKANAGDIVRTDAGGPLPFGPWTPRTVDTNFPSEIDDGSSGNPAPRHDQAALGHLAYMPGSNIVSSTVLNPYTLFANGITKFNMTSGERSGQDIGIFSSTFFPEFFQKTNGLGDLELMVRYPCCLQITCARVIAGTLHLVVTNNCLNDDLNEVDEPHTLAGLNCFSLRDVRTGELPPLQEPPEENAFAYDVRHDLALEEDVVLPLGLVIQDKLTGKRHFVKILLPEDEPGPCQ